MRLLLLTDGIFPFQLGGMQKYALTLARLLLKNNVNIHVVHCGGEGYNKDKFQSLFEGYAVGEVKETVVKFPKTDPFPGHYIRENKVYSKNIFLEMKDHLNSFDLIYAQGFSGWRFIKEKNMGTFSIPIFVNFHGFEMFQSAPNLKTLAAYSLLKNAVKWNVRNADYIYSFGGKIDKIVESLGVKPPKILRHSNGIEENWITEEIPKNNAIRRFVFVGRAERRKGIEELNEVLSFFIQSDEIQFQFDFIGPIKENLQLEDSRINYHGTIKDGERIKEILKTADCLVCPSHAEGMPTVILEAMASGLAIIATEVGAVKRLVKGNGILLEKPDIDQLKNALFYVVNNSDDELSDWKKKSVELVQSNFIWKQVIQQKLLHFEQAITDE